MENQNFKFSNVDTVELAKKFGTPLYVMSENIIVAKINHIKKHFLDKYPKTKAFYASKAFLSLRMCEIIKREGIGLDAVSAGEIYTALKVGFPAQNIVFHGNNKTEDEMRYALENKIGEFVVDSISEIELLKKLTEEMGINTSVLVRINPSTESETHKHLNTGQKDCKFGIPLTKVTTAISMIKDSSKIKYGGIHFHVGSMLFKNDFHIIAAKKALTLIKEIKDALGLDTEILNIGGGFGVDHLDSNNTVSFERFMEEIMMVVTEEFSKANLPLPQVYIEPGRWIAAESGITLYSIGVIKSIPDARTYCSVDGGMPDNPRPSLYDAKYKAVVINKCNEKADTVVTIAGKCCETGDILIKDINLPKLERGDFLAILATGAYNYSMSSNYNRIPRPAIVFIKDGKAELSVKRESYEDMLSLDTL